MLQRAHFGQRAFLVDDDRRAYLAALSGGAAANNVALHAYVLLDDHVHLLATPQDGPALGRMMQGLGRRYGAAFNRRHQRTGALWGARYSAAPVDSVYYLLDAMLFIEQHPVRAGLAVDAAEYVWSSARHHLGRAHESWITDAAQYWKLGNTPFERETAYAALLAEPLALAHVQRLAEAGRKGWALGPPRFLEQLARTTTRPLTPRPRGRPRKSVV
jgi:putative transposase